MAVNPTYGQNYVDIFKLEYSIGTGNEFVDSSEEADVAEWIADLTIPVPLNDNNTFLTGFLYENVNVNLFPSEGRSSVYTLNLKLGLNQTYNEKWSATYIALPKFSSDLKEMKGDDFQIGIVSIFKKIISDKLNIKFGGYYNTDLYGPFVVPLAGLYFQSNKWEINTLLPASFDANYSLHDKIRLGIKFNGFIKSFNLNVDFNGDPQYLGKANNEVGPYLGLLMGPVYLNLMVGTSIGRSYRTYQNGDQMDIAISAVKIGDDRAQLNTDFEDGLIIKSTFIYRFSLDSNSTN